MCSGRAVFTVLSLFVSSYAVADVTGTWSGSLSGPIGCPSGPPATQTFSVTLALLQSGNLVAGELIAVGPHDACVSGGPTETDDLSLSGNIFGAALTATYTLIGNGSHKFNAAVNGASMSVSAETSDGTPLSGTLTQTSTQPPASGLSGTYTGTIAIVFVPCGVLPPVTFNGTAKVGVIQVGNSINGYITSNGGFIDQLINGSCSVTNDPNPETHEFQGILSGSTIAGVAPWRDGLHPLTASVNGNSISGTVSGEFPGESTTFNVTLSTAGLPAAGVVSFTATPASIALGDSSTLAWTTVDATSVSVDNGIGTKPPSGSVPVSPSQTTTYTLTATGPSGSATAQATVTVAPAGPRIVISRLPSGMLEAAGTSGATDGFTITNVGTASSNVTLTQSGNFFAISPGSFTLAAGSSQVVGITANSQPAGAYDGSITVSGGPTVPVHLLVVGPPTAAVNPQPAAPRSDVSAPAGQNPSGSVQFTNKGAGSVTGIAVADVPWIVPQTGAINIGPGQTTTVSFNIDRSQRVRATGGESGKLSLVFLLSVSSKRAIANGTTPTGSVSVTIVDVVKPNVAPGAPPALPSGQVALYIAGLRTANRFSGDLTIAGRPDVPSISDLLMYFRAGTNPAQIGTVPAFTPSSGITFPAISKNVFGIVGTGGGSLQLRSTQTPSLALSAVVALNDPNSAISSATALPILRSDRSIGAGERLVFSGAQDSQTLVWIQEVSGNAGHVSFQFLSASGAVIGSDSGDVTAFALIAEPVPDGTRAIVVQNDSSSGGRFAGYAAINDPTTNDGWVLTDSLHHWASATGPLIMPLVAAAPNDVYVTNTSSSAPASVSIEQDSGSRHHATRPTGANLRSIAVAPMGTEKVTFGAADGYVRISSGSAITAAGRVTLSASGATFGSSLPAVPAGAALGNGQGERFTGVDDASAKTVASGTPATYRSTLMLVETTGQTATVRVTLRYNFVAGATVSAQGVSSRDIVVGPNQMAVIGDLARSIIGAQRDTFGDLRNMQVDIDVIDGSGKVLPFVESIDNASGDIMVRAE